MKLTIYHNPRCSKSRRTLEIIRERGIEPDVVLYLEDTPAAETLLDIGRMLGAGLDPLIRESEQAYREADDLPEGDERALAEWLAAHPKAIQRPVVVEEESRRAVIGRPPESVLALLDPPAGGNRSGDRQA